MLFFLRLSHLHRTSSYPSTLQSSNHCAYIIVVVITLDIDKPFGPVYISIWSRDIGRQRAGSLDQRHPPSSMQRLPVVPQTVSVVKNNMDSCLSVCPSTVTFRLVSTWLILTRQYTVSRNMCGMRTACLCVVSPVQL
jgi:hypothetical protein